MKPSKASLSGIWCRIINGYWIHLRLSIYAVQELMKNETSMFIFHDVNCEKRKKRTNSNGKKEINESYFNETEHFSCWIENNEILMRLPFVEIRLRCEIQRIYHEFRELLDHLCTTYQTEASVLQAFSLMKLLIEFLFEGNYLGRHFTAK